MKVQGNIVSTLVLNYVCNKGQDSIKHKLALIMYDYKHKNLDQMGKLLHIPLSNCQRNLLGKVLCTCLYYYLKKMALK